MGEQWNADRSALEADALPALTQNEIDRRVFDLYDEYCHGRIDRREFLERAGALTIGGVSALAMAQALLPRYAQAQTISFTDQRIQARYVTYPSPGGSSGTIRVAFEILEVKQLQGDAGLATFAVDVRAVRPRPRGALGDRDEGACVEPGLQRLLGQGLDGGPVQPGVLGPLQDDGDGAEADVQALGHLPVRPAQHPLLAEDLADLSHG
ncbi:MAG: hypothetical protein ACREM3_19590 [Candidatus Rokuibacteriota bacterium]